MKPYLRVLLLPGLLLSSIAAFALELPDMKPGLWQVTMTSSTGDPRMDKPRTVTRCVDATEQAKARQMAIEHAKKSCSKNDTHREGAAWVTDTVCTEGRSNAKVTTHSVTTMSADNEGYHTEMSTTFDPPANGRSHSGLIIDGKRTGACAGR